MIPKGPRRAMFEGEACRYPTDSGAGEPVGRGVSGNGLEMTLRSKVMKRIYFLVPDIETTRKIVDGLLLARVEERHIHVLAKRGTPLEDLPEATFLQKTDFIPALEQGIAVGGMTGMLAGLVAVALPTGLVLGGGAVLAISLLGAGFGAWASSMIGASTGNRQLKDYEDAIGRGELLVMVDVPKERVEEVEELVKKHHPEAECEGTEPTIPPFP
jgi:hypothetical protein